MHQQSLISFLLSPFIKRKIDKLPFLMVTLLVCCCLMQCAFAGSYEDFFNAIELDKADQISIILAKGFDPNTPSENGEPPLIVAVKKGSVKVVQTLLSIKGIDIDRTNLQDENALMFAVFNNNIEIAQRLINSGSEVNKTGWTPLHYASTKGDILMIKLLLDQSAYIDAESPNGTTPLMMASRYADEQSVRFLIEQGADPTIKNQLDLRASDFANMRNNASVSSYLLKQEQIWKELHH